jgi:AraC-like DNA-binding protein
LIAGGLGSQDIVAETLGMSCRSLRRRLMEDGTTWRSVVQDEKFAKAAELLQRGNASVGQIARELGFSDPAHFTRFFRSRAGVVPSRWQRRVEQARDLARSSA